MIRVLLALFLLLVVSVPLSAQEPVDLVAKHRGSSPTLSPADAPRVLKAIAAELNLPATRTSGMWGVLRKTSGNHCGGYSCDIICRSDGQHWDVFADGPDGGDNPEHAGPSRPQWSLVAGSIDPSRCELVPASVPSPSPAPAPAPPPVPEPAPSPGTDLGPVLLRIVERLERIQSLLQGIHSSTWAMEEGQQKQTDALKAAIAELQAQVKQGVKIRF